jgi:hypothetical protein
MLREIGANRALGVPFACRPVRGRGTFPQALKLREPLAPLCVPNGSLP